MGQRVAGPRRRSKPTPVSRERRRAQQRAVRRRLGGAIAAVIRDAIEAALEAEVTALAGRARYARRAAAPLRRAGVRCSQCGQDWAPRLGCRCRGTVQVEFATLGR